jgi:hypothetical protein
MNAKYFKENPYKMRLKSIILWNCEAQLLNYTSNIQKNAGLNNLRNVLRKYTFTLHNPAGYSSQAPTHFSDFEMKKKSI